MIHKLIYPKYNLELLDYNIIEINISDLENPLNLKDLNSENITIVSKDDKDETKYIRIASIRFGFGDTETYHYLIDNEFDIPYFKTGFEETKKTIKEDFNYLSTEEKKKMYLDNFLISMEIYFDEQTEKYMNEINEEQMFPIIYNGKSYSKEECDDIFLAHYPCIEALNSEGGVYVSDDRWIYPDGTMNEF